MSKYVATIFSVLILFIIFFLHFDSYRDQNVENTNHVTNSYPLEKAWHTCDTNGMVHEFFPNLLDYELSENDECIAKHLTHKFSVQYPKELVLSHEFPGTGMLLGWNITIHPVNGLSFLNMATVANFQENNQYQQVNYILEHNLEENSVIEVDLKEILPSYTESKKVRRYFFEKGGRIWLISVTDENYSQYSFEESINIVNVIIPTFETF